VRLLILALLTCNQVIYDQIYKELVMNVINHKLTQKRIDQKNNSIELLRELCNGQKSSYETKETK
jgi:hypothetical protein